MTELMYHALTLLNAVAVASLVLWQLRDQSANHEEHEDLREALRELVAEMNVLGTRVYVLRRHLPAAAERQHE